jgi:hypothetical protein
MADSVFPSAGSLFSQFYFRFVTKQDYYCDNETGCITAQVVTQIH